MLNASQQEYFATGAMEVFHEKNICEMVLELAEFASIPLAEITELAVRRVNGMEETEK